MAALNSDAFEALAFGDVGNRGCCGHSRPSFIHLTSTAANETDKSKIQAMGAAADKPTRRGRDRR